MVMIIIIMITIMFFFLIVIIIITIIIYTIVHFFHSGIRMIRCFRWGMIQPDMPWLRQQRRPSPKQRLQKRRLHWNPHGAQLGSESCANLVPKLPQKLDDFFIGPFHSRSMNKTHVFGTFLGIFLRYACRHLFSGWPACKAKGCGSEVGHPGGGPDSEWKGPISWKKTLSKYGW